MTAHLTFVNPKTGERTPLHPIILSDNGSISIGAMEASDFSEAAAHRITEHLTRTLHGCFVLLSPTPTP